MYRIGRRRIAVDRAEIALAVDQRHAHGEILRHAHHRVVNRLVAVRMIFTDHVADDARGFDVLLVRRMPLLVHRVENAAMHGLQARRAHPAAPAPRSRSWRNRGRSASSRRGWKRDEYRRAPAARRACYLQVSDKGESGQFSAENHIAYRGSITTPKRARRGRFSLRFFMDLRGSEAAPSAPPEPAFQGPKTGRQSAAFAHRPMGRKPPRA